MNMGGWDWLDKLIAGAAKPGPRTKPRVSSQLTNTSGISSGEDPSFHILCVKGGSGFGMAVPVIPVLPQTGFNPATLHLLGGFLAVGTQMKLERPGKACGVVPVDTIEGPTVRLTGGEVIRVDDEKTALTVMSKVERIIDVGEILIAYGDFLENNHPLVPAGYCEEWWLLDQGPGAKPPLDETGALTLAKSGGFAPALLAFFLQSDRWHSEQHPIRNALGIYEIFLLDERRKDKRMVIITKVRWFPDRPRP